MKSIIARVAATLLCTHALILQATAEDLHLKEEGKLYAGSDLIFPPYNYLEDGEAKGLDADILAVMAKRLKLNVEFVDTRFTSLIPGLRAKRFDMIASAMYVTGERAKVIDFVPYALSGGSLVVLEGAPVSPEKVEDLCGLRVGSQQGAAWIPSLTKTSADTCADKPISIQEFSTSAEAGQALFSRGVDVQIVDAAVGKAAVDAAKGRLRITTKTLLYPVVIGFGFLKDDKSLSSTIQKTLDEMKQSGEFKAVLDKYSLSAPTDDDVAKSLRF